MSEPPTPGEEIARLENLLTRPPLVLVAEGGGLPDRCELRHDHALLIGREHVERLVALLRRLTPDAPHVVQE